MDWKINVVLWDITRPRNTTQPRCHLCVLWTSKQWLYGRVVMDYRASFCVLARAVEPLFQCCWQHSSFNIFLQHSWSVDLSNYRWKTEQMPAKLSISPSDHLFWSFLLARRRWRQQQILSGDTHSIKGALHHPDGLCRPLCTRRAAQTCPRTPPPDTEGCCYYRTTPGYVQKLPVPVGSTWSSFTQDHYSSVSCFSPLTTEETVFFF